jgi:hypothetical protein
VRAHYRARTEALALQASGDIVPALWCSLPGSGEALSGGTLGIYFPCVAHHRLLKSNFTAQ